MDRDMAAYYCGLSPNTFDMRVKEGRLPKAHQDGRRLLWDIHELDRALGDDHHLDGSREQGAQSDSHRAAAAEAAALAAISGR